MHYKVIVEFLDGRPSREYKNVVSIATESYGIEIFISCIDKNSAIKVVHPWNSIRSYASIQCLNNQDCYGSSSAIVNDLINIKEKRMFTMSEIVDMILEENCSETIYESDEKGKDDSIEAVLDDINERLNEQQKEFEAAPKTIFGQSINDIILGGN